MKTRVLKDLLKGVNQYELKGDVEVSVSGITIDSRRIETGYLFAALRGSVNGHDFIKSAVKSGARAILCEEWPEQIEKDCTFIKVLDSREAIGFIADNFYEKPSSKLKCIGVTGTNGKTTVATLLYGLFKELGLKVGLISTVEILVNEKKWDSTLTTPDVISLHRLLNIMVDEECSHVFMEVSSHAAVQKRIAGVRFEGGIFTNISHDHLDYHGNFSNYIKAKQFFFSNLKEDAFALTNIDDKNGEIMIQNSKAHSYRYSLQRLTDYKGKVVSEDQVGMLLEINRHQFMTRLTGRFNASNLTAVYATAKILLNFQDEELIEKLSGVRTAKGRMEVIHFHPRIVVDYAHTPDALKNVIKSLRVSITNGKLITVVGCGGNRDKAKRPIMGKIASELSDVAIFTSDNPRDENPLDIISEMKTDLDKKERARLLEIEDRKSAIKTSIALADKKDTVLIAGKGHEQFQEINGEKHFFSDQQIVKDILSEDI